MRFHLLGLPHTQVTREFCSCAFTNKIFFFAKMMRSLGHEVFLYAGDQCETDVTERVVCFTEEERLVHCNGVHYTAASWNPNDPGWKTFNNRCIEEIKKRNKPHDFICIMGGIAQKPVADAVPWLMSVEYGIGHGGSFSKYRVFESYAWQHCVYGAETYGQPGSADGRWFDCVIPGYFDIDEFPFSAEKEDYVLFVGRLTERKGPHVAAEICKTAGIPLKVAGQGEPPKNCEYVGVVNAEERGRLMSKARCLIMPTLYIEPFGNVAVEAQACGTPVITVPWGAMVETVVEGVTGFHCHTMNEFVTNIEKCKSLDPNTIRNHARNNYSLPIIAGKYEKHFERLLTLWKGGWYELAA
jgi:glycosyltransferase involved in cell wall biosynthesis